MSHILLKSLEFHKIKHFCVVLILFSISLFHLTSCNEDPTSLGFPLDTLSVYSISSDDDDIITNSENEVVRLQTLYLKPYTFLGKYKDISAVTFIRYKTFPDTLTYVNESKIVSAKLRLRPLRYALGDTVTGNLGFDIYQLKNFFVKETTWEEIYPNSEVADAKSDYYDSKKVGSYSGKIIFKDTLDEFKVDIDKKMISDWLRFAEKGDSSYYSFSLALVPNDNSTFVGKLLTNGLIAGKNFDQSIELVYEHKSNKLDTILLSTAYYSSFVNAKKVTDNNKIVIQGGVASRSRLEFDLSKIPPRSSIVKAQLELSIIDEESYCGNWSRDTTLTAGNDSIQTVTYNVPYAAVREKNSIKYVFPSISSAVQMWNLADGKGKLTIYANRNGNDYEEPNNLDRYVFYGTKTSDKTKRPRLTVFYTKRPNL